MIANEAVVVHSQALLKSRSIAVSEANYHPRLTSDGISYMVLLIRIVPSTTETDY